MPFGMKTPVSVTARVEMVGSGTVNLACLTAQDGVDAIQSSLAAVKVTSTP